VGGINPPARVEEVAFLPLGWRVVPWGILIVIGGDQSRTDILCPCILICRYSSTRTHVAGIGSRVMRRVIGHPPPDDQSYTKVLLLSDDDSTRLFPCCLVTISYTC